MPSHRTSKRNDKLEASLITDKKKRQQALARFRKQLLYSLKVAQRRFGIEYSVAVVPLQTPGTLFFERSEDVAEYVQLDTLHRELEEYTKANQDILRQAGGEPPIQAIGEPKR